MGRGADIRILSPGSGANLMCDEVISVQKFIRSMYGRDTWDMDRSLT